MEDIEPNGEINSEGEEDDSWKVDLETTLLGECDFGTLRNICRGRSVPDHLRKDVWRICLNASNQSSSLDDFNEMFNLPEQEELRQDCQTFVNSLSDVEDKLQLLSDVESVCTHFSRTYGIPYKAENGWLSIMRVLMDMKLDRYDLYAYFSGTIHRYIAAGFNIDNRAFAVFRLLLQYHDPELCSFLDTKRVSTDNYAYSWFTSLFTSDASPMVVPKLLDIYFLVADPFLMFFLALVILINAKEQLLECLEIPKDQIIQRIRGIPPALESEDIEDFVSLAQHYGSRTPESLRAKFGPLLFGNAQLDEDGNAMIQALCLPLSVHELLQAQSEVDRTVKFILVDCRPPEQYNAGHLATAFYLDSQLMLRNPTEFQTTAKALLMTQRRAVAAGSVAAGDHIALLSSGRDEEDRVVYMVIAHFLQRKTPFVSMVYGGYAALHDVLGPNCARSLVGHDPKLCLQCAVGEAGSETGDSEASYGASGVPRDRSMGNLIHMFQSAVKTTSSHMKEKVINYVKNETAQHDSGKQPRHVSHRDRVSKPYRNVSNVFSIEDNNEELQGGDFDSSESGSDMGASSSKYELVNLEVWLSKPDILHHFPCQLVKRDNTLHAGHLLLTDRHLFVLRHVTGQGDGKAKPKMAHILYRRSLATVVKITSKKKLPELISFHYGSTGEDGLGRVVDCDRAIIKEAGEAARLIKIQIQKVLDAMPEK